MVLLDTNVFIIDRFFKRDERYQANKAFIEHLSETQAGFSIFSLFELCGISSFNLSPTELKQWMYQFDEVYSVTILEPRGLYTQLAGDWFEQFTASVLELLARRMTWGDAVLVQTAEEYGTDAIVTWNKKHFEGKTTVNVLTPEEYLVTKSAARESDRG